jgi:hypothetical protein
MTNYTRALFLSNTAEERVEFLRILANREKLLHDAGNLALRDVAFTMKRAT